MALFDEKVSSQLKSILSGMKSDIQLAFFTQEIECPMCRETRLFLEEFCALSGKLTLSVYDFVKDKEKAETHRVDKIPAIVVLDSKGNDTGIKFYGLPGGYEINSFIKSLLEASGQKEELPALLMSRVMAIKKDIHIQVFVTLSCPFCPAAVMAAHRLALENPNIRADMVESTTFVPLAVRYGVQSVPMTVINETQKLIGAQPIERLVEAIENA
ncbi:MAG: thioredoxin family protein [Spirochaetes bacterium]|nr:thioredoxin family protein [Spirochaetota bacterium]